MAAFEPDLFQKSLDRANVRDLRTFHVKVTYGSSAVASARGLGIQALNDTAAGKMTIYFPRTYRELLGFRWGWVKCAAGAVYFPVILTNSIDSADATYGGGSVIVETRTEAGTATDPASGDILVLEFDVSLDASNDERAITVT